MSLQPILASRRLSQKVTQFLVLFFCLLAATATCHRYANDPMERGGAVHDYEFDFEVSESAKNDRNRLSTYEFLETHGLRQIADQLSQFISIFDSSTHFFDQINDTSEFEILNHIISIFRDSFVATVDEAKRSSEAKGGSISLSSMRDFISRHEMIFNERLQMDPRFKKWSKIISQTHIVFDAFKQLYQLCIENGMPLPWWMLQLIGPLCSNIPDRLLDHQSFEEVLRLPSMIQSSLHSVLEEAFTSGYGPMLKIAIQALANWAAGRHDEL